MEKISVLIVDDSPFIRKLFTDMLNAEPDISVVDTACDPFDAREKIKRHDPRVVTLDIEMPQMDGISFLEKIMSLRPMPVIMASTLTQKGASETLRALEIGAVDYISKPLSDGTVGAFRAIGRELADKIRIAAQVDMGRRTQPAKIPGVLPYQPQSGEAAVIAIGSSTGGVEALRHIFSELPANAPPIVIAQHMPATFTPSFAARLNDLSQVKVSEAKHGDKLMRGHAYVAPGGIHLTVTRQRDSLTCKLSDGMPVSGHKPSVDVLFSSVATATDGNAIGAILTGMGRDGAAGLLKMRNAGCHTIAQSKRSCVVFGMPGSAVALDAVDAEVNLSDIASMLLEKCAARKQLETI